MLDDQSLDFRAFAKEQGLGNLSLGSNIRLMEVLGIESGSVTSFVAIKACPEEIVILLDADMMQYSLLNYHFLRNNMTVGVGKEYFLEFFECVGHCPKVVKLPKR